MSPFLFSTGSRLACVPKHMYLMKYIPCDKPYAVLWHRHWLHNSVLLHSGLQALLFYLLIRRLLMIFIFYEEHFISYLFVYPSTCLTISEPPEPLFEVIIVYAKTDLQSISDEILIVCTRHTSDENLSRHSQFILVLKQLSLLSQPSAFTTQHAHNSQTQNRLCYALSGYFDSFILRCKYMIFFFLNVTDVWNKFIKADFHYATFFVEQYL